MPRQTLKDRLRLAESLAEARLYQVNQLQAQVQTLQKKLTERSAQTLLGERGRAIDAVARLADSLAKLAVPEVF